MENPLKLTRLSLDLTQEGLAKKAGLSKSSVIRTEQGLYSSPPPQLLKALNMDYSKTLPLYTAFQTLHRASNNSRSANPYFTWQNFSFLVEPSLAYRHPFEILLEGRSILDFCKAFCVTPNLVTRWVKKYWLVTSVPTLILELFDETGYDGDLLVEAYDRFLYEKKVMLLTPQQRKEIREVQKRDTLHFYSAKETISRLASVGGVAS